MGAPAAQIVRGQIEDAWTSMVGNVQPRRPSGKRQCLSLFAPYLR